MKYFIIFFLVSAALSAGLSAQPQLWEVYTVSGEPYIDIVVDKYEYDSLHIKSANFLYTIHRDSIAYLVKRNDSHFGLGFLIGAAAGGTIGYASSNEDSKYNLGNLGRTTSCIAGILLGGTAGGLMGMAAGTDKEYNLQKLSPEQREILLKSLFD